MESVSLVSEFSDTSRRLVFVCNYNLTSNQKKQINYPIIKNNNGLKVENSFVYNST